MTRINHTLRAEVRELRSKNHAATLTRTGVVAAVKVIPTSPGPDRSHGRYNPVVAKTFDRIARNPNLLAGRATIRGLRMSVAHVITSSPTA